MNFHHTSAFAWVWKERHTGSLDPSFSPSHLAFSVNTRVRAVERICHYSEWKARLFVWGKKKPGVAVARTFWSRTGRWAMAVVLPMMVPWSCLAVRWKLLGTLLQLLLPEMEAIMPLDWRGEEGLCQARGAHFHFPLPTPRKPCSDR